MVMRETFDGFQGGLQIGGRIVTNLRYADDIILLATSEAELQELVDRLDRVSRKYSLVINVDKNKLMASDGIACRILIQNEQPELHIYRQSKNVTHPVHCPTYEKVHKIDKYIVVYNLVFKPSFYRGYYMFLSFNFWVKVKLGKRKWKLGYPVQKHLGT